MLLTCSLNTLQRDPLDHQVKAVPRINSKSAQGTVSYHSPTFWNSLLQELCSAAALCTFKSKIKSYLVFTNFSFLILHYLLTLCDSIVSYMYMYIYAYPFLCAWACNSILSLVLYDVALFLI